MGLIGRAASLAGVPLGAGARFAGAATKVALGADRLGVYDKATAASVEAAVATLAKVRGPAMKFGQVLAVFTSALPPEVAQRFVALERLYEQADPLPFADLSHLLAVVPDGRLVVEPEAVAAASLGQVHRGTWTDPGTGERRPVAVKLRYPDAPRAVRSDMLQLRALVPIFGRLLPTLDLKALLAEHTERLVEELDYRNEARWMERFARAWADGPVVVPDVLFASESVLVSSWLDGTPLSELVRAAADPDRLAGSRAERDLAGQLLVEFCFYSPERVHAQHADPHPGNFRLTAD
ncbi:MAG: AarF/UbiB family protein, partial [Mycobacteriales bacterium]